MEEPHIVEQQRRRFYDGGDPGNDSGAPAEPPDPDKDVLIVLDRILKADADGKQRERFLLRRRIAYLDRHCGEIVVPPAYKAFECDLASVPALFTWLVPKTGAHLPAALLHDGLVWNPAKESKTYISTEGKEIDRVEADRIFRDGMADTGTALVRRWLIWTAVTVGTMWSRTDTSTQAIVRTYYRWLVPATLVAIGWLGYVATADLFDRTDRWWRTYELPWMGDHLFAWELASGVAGAIVIPMLIGILWGRFRRAGWILGIGVAVLFHVTIAILAVTAVYVTLEWAAGKLLSAGLLRLAGLIVVTAAAVVVVVGVLR